MKTITNKTILKQGDNTYIPVEVDGVIYWVGDAEGWSSTKICYNNDGAIGQPINRESKLIVAQSQPKLEGVPIISLDSYVERISNIKHPDESTPGWLDTFSYLERKGFINGYKSNPNQYTQKDIDKAIELAQQQYWDIRGFSSNTEGDWSFKYTEEEIFDQINSISVIEVNEQFNIINYE
jgi:hypothetical protein